MTLLACHSHLQVSKYVNILEGKYVDKKVGNLLTSKNLQHFAPMLSLAIFVILSSSVLLLLFCLG